MRAELSGLFSCQIFTPQFKDYLCSESFEIRFKNELQRTECRNNTNFIERLDTSKMNIHLVYFAAFLKLPFKNFQSLITTLCSVYNYTEVNHFIFQKKN